MMMPTEYDWPGQGQILAFSREAVEQVCREASADDLHALLALALDREAVVSSAYLGSAVTHRLGILATRQPTHAAIIEVIRQSITFVWLQEESHTNLLRNIEAELLSSPQAARWHELFGRAKGMLTQLAAGNQFVVDKVAQAVIRIGSALGLSPSFSEDITNLSNRAFFSFSRELEAAAIVGYEQIQERVNKTYAATGEVPLNLGLLTILGEILIDELRHHQIFAAIRNWFTGDDLLRTTLRQPECAQRMLAIFQDTPKRASAGDEPQYQADEHELLLDEQSAAFLRQLGVRDIRATADEKRRKAALSFLLQY